MTLNVDSVQYIIYNIYKIPDLKHGSKSHLLKHLFQLLQCIFSQADSFFIAAQEQDEHTAKMPRPCLGPTFNLVSQPFFPLLSLCNFIKVAEIGKQTGEGQRDNIHS